MNLNPVLPGCHTLSAVCRKLEPILYHFGQFCIIKSEILPIVFVVTHKWSVHVQTFELPVSMVDSINVNRQIEHRDGVGDRALIYTIIVTT